MRPCSNIRVNVSVSLGSKLRKVVNLVPAATSSSGSHRVFQKQRRGTMAAAGVVPFPKKKASEASVMLHMSPEREEEEVLAHAMEYVMVNFGIPKHKGKRR